MALDPFLIRETEDALGTLNPSGPRGSMGQNFLLDQFALERIVEVARFSPDDIVQEVGCGLGHLTAVLSPSVARIHGYEVDRRLHPYLENIGFPNLELRGGDYLEAIPFSDGATRIIGNLPYNLSSRIILHILDSWNARQEELRATGDTFSMVFTLQREFAQRLVAGPGSKAYGRLTVKRAWTAFGELSFDIPPTSFHPEPQVTSSVVVLIPFFETWAPGERKVADAIVDCAFQQRRKKFRNGLRPLLGLLQGLDVVEDPEAAFDTLMTHLGEVGLADERAEMISPEGYRELARITLGL